MKTVIFAVIFCSAFLMQHPLRAQEQHADYVVLGKSINHRQTAVGSLNFLNTVFFAEIFATGGGAVSNGVSVPDEFLHRLCLRSKVASQQQGYRSERDRWTRERTMSERIPWPTKSSLC